ncbi:MAG TPA: hypothetical protein VN843_29125, partial [Anaerolineales bacterium]|nr:hypothetical protein [Anaerolineales bacterium]
VLLQGANGIGELGIVGTAAIANAVYQATASECATCRSPLTNSCDGAPKTSTGLRSAYWENPNENSIYASYGVFVRLFLLF